MLDNSPFFTMIELGETRSTNSFLKGYRPIAPTDITLVTAEYQSAGRGQAGHTWESESSQNLLFSLMVRPQALPAKYVFVLSEAIALSIRDAIVQVLKTHLSTTQGLPPSDPLAATDDCGVTVKWPNDVYVADSKIAGILIENDFCGAMLERSIIGCGIDVNQQDFAFHTPTSATGDGIHTTPTPVSLRQLIGHDVERRFVLDAIITSFRRRYLLIRGNDAQAIAAIHDDYRHALYRREGIHSFRDAGGSFSASIADVEPSGRLVLRDTDGHIRRYAFKEVAYLIP